MTEGLDVRRGADPLLIKTGAEFAAALTELRHRAGLSIRDVARTTGIPSATLGGYFSGRHLPPATQPQLLGQVLDALGFHDATIQEEWDEALLRARQASSARGPGAADEQPGWIGPGGQWLRLWQRGEAGYAPAGELPAVGEPAPIYTSAFSPSGQLLAIGTANGDAILWDLSDVAAPTQVAVLDSAESSVQSSAFSADGTQLAVGTSEPALRRWVLPSSDGETPEELAPITEEFAGMVKSVAYSPDAAVLATGSADGAIRLWSVPADGAPELLSTSRVGEATNFVHAVAFSPEGALLGSAEKDRVVRLWDVSNPRSPEQRAEPLGGFDSWVNSVQFSPDGQSVAAGSSDGTARVFAVEDGQPLLTVPAPAAVNDAQFVGDGAALLTSEVDGVARLWPLPGPVLSLGVRGLPPGVAFSPDSSLLVVGSTDGSVHIWRLAGAGAGATAQELAPLTGFENYVYGVTFDPTGQYLAAGSTDRTLRIWDMADPAAAVPVGGATRGPADTVYALSWGADGTLAGASKEGKLWLWDVADPAAPKPQATLLIAEGNLFPYEASLRPRCSSGST